MEGTRDYYIQIGEYIPFDQAGFAHFQQWPSSLGGPMGEQILYFERKMLPRKRQAMRIVDNYGM